MDRVNSGLGVLLSLLLAVTPLVLTITHPPPPNTGLGKSVNDTPSVCEPSIGTNTVFNRDRASILHCSLLPLSVNERLLSIGEPIP
jgi:hypothetical protein